jgi:sulfite exporter TauE/SafE
MIIVSCLRRRLSLSDLLVEISQASLAGVIPIGLTAGFLGSLHCIGMCGAFAANSSSQWSQLFSYHFGKLISYSILGLFAGLMGSSLTALFKDPYLKAIPAIFLGLLFIWLGIKSSLNKKPTLRFPTVFNQWISKKLTKTYHLRPGAFRSFSIGFLSALLPCGLLYGVIVSFSALQSPLHGAIGMASFSLGTLPALTLAPKLIIKVLEPIKKFWPRLTSISLLSLGLLTITYRLVLAYEQANCH